MLAGESPTVYGDGGQSRDFTFINNVIHANQAALAAPVSACGRIYNIACGESATLLDLIDGINDILGTSIRPQHVAPRAGDVRHSLADVSAAAEAFGYQPRVKLREALRLTVEWYRGRQTLPEE
jgi:UDP-glucose 4-epimerase